MWGSKLYIVLWINLWQCNPEVYFIRYIYISIDHNYPVYNCNISTFYQVFKTQCQFIHYLHSRVFETIQFNNKSFTAGCKVRPGVSSHVNLFIFSQNLIPQGNSGRLKGSKINFQTKHIYQKVRRNWSQLIPAIYWTQYVNLSLNCNPNYFPEANIYFSTSFP